MNPVLALIRSVALIFVLIFTVLYIPHFDTMLFNFSEFADAYPNFVVLLQISVVFAIFYYVVKPAIMMLEEMFTDE